MTTPIVRGFNERVWIGRDPKGDPCWTTDEAEARAYAAKPGWRIAEYSFVRELHVDRAAANEPPWEDLPEQPNEARP